MKNVIQKVKGGALDEGKGNCVIVGTICAPSFIPKSSCGELLNSIQNLKFGRGTTRKNDNIKFLF